MSTNLLNLILWFTCINLDPFMKFHTSKDRDFLEVFSGRGEISRAMRDVSGCCYVWVIGLKKSYL